MKMAQVFDAYYQRHVLLKTRRPSNALHFWRRHIAPTWAEVEATSIKRAHVQDWIDRIGAEYSRSSANRSLDVLAASWRWALKREYFAAINDPFLAVEKFTLQPRERFLMPEELARFRAALDEETPLMRDFFYMCLLTGARRGNVQSMRWNDISLSLRQWTFDNKNGSRHTVPLTDAALAILIRRSQFSETEYVFATNSKTGHLVEPKRAWQRILKRSRIEGLTVHDLRRTVGSYLAIAGESNYIIAKTLGHADPRSSNVYARLDLQPVRNSLEKIQMRILES